jgi:hypothetical protein
MKITGTRTHSSVLTGTKTLYVVQPVDEAFNRELRERYAALKQASEQAKQNRAKRRKKA